ncbi:MAG: MBL fold metallo-hydrolase [Chloroflexi bacterium]|nr:MBL fold metallo-hydrolase [Chloroflexota bacterium]MBV9600596.1 MBL fold metallo-hydrolase [Chloroflexota bacterium]
MNIGDLVAEPIYDGVMRAPATVFYRDTTTEQWAPHQRFLEPDGMIRFDLGGFLVRGRGDRVVLIDAGMGPRSGLIRDGRGSFEGGQLLNNLATHRVRPEDITDVLFTHLHFDHVGWAANEGDIVFPNATYRCDIRDLEHFRDDERVRGTLAVIESRLETWDGSGPVCPGIDAMSAPGHTPGSTIVVMSSGTARGMLLGDVVHCPVELLEDEWAGVGDLDPELAKRTRTALNRELEGTDTPVAAAHFPGMVFGRLLAAEGRRNWVV